MAHIPDGVLSIPVIAAGTAITVAAVAVALRHLEETAIPRTAILAAAFFTTSAIAIPVGPSSVHLLLSGLMGLTLGILAFPAVLVGLLLQAALFGFGGLTTLGINTLNIAMPGVVMAMLFGPAITRATPPIAALLAATASVIAVAATAACVSLSLALSSPDYIPSAKIIVATYVPLMIIEAIITAFCIHFLKRVKPEIFETAGAG